ncbi:MAG: T9SS type A sorting domain-containing protein [Bacteroidales bacterium]
MKKIYVLLLISLIYFGLHSQPVITTNVLPVIGDTILMSFDSTLIPAGASGVNVNWDFSTTLHQDFVFARVYLNPINTPYSTSFPNAKLCRTDGIGSAYSYWDNTNNNKSVCYGFVEPNYYTQNYNNLPLSYYKFPILFGNSYIDSISAVTNPGNLIGSGKYYFNADAWGTIKLPNKTVSNVLRTKSISYIGDSSIAVNSYSLTTEYAWFQASKKEPLLVISSIIINHVLYKKFVLFDNTASIGIEKNETSKIFKITPNPAKDIIYINSENSKFNENNEVSIFDILGKKVFSVHLSDFSNSKSIDICSLSKGIYIIKITNGQQTFQQKFIKE